MSVAEKCLHFSMTECSRGRRRRQKRVKDIETPRKKEISMSENEKNAEPAKPYIVRDANGVEYLIPTYPATFRALMDDKDTIRDMLNSILELDHDHEIIDLTYEFEKYIDVFMPGDEPMKLDVWVTTKDNRFMDIELQNRQNPFFGDRMRLYNAYQTLRGKHDYNKSEQFSTFTEYEKKVHYYEVPETVSIWLCGFSILKPRNTYKDTWMLYSKYDVNQRDKNAVEPLPLFSKNKYIVVDLIKFAKLHKGVNSHEDFWLQLLCEGPLSVPETENPLFLNALDRLRVSNAKPELLKSMEEYMFDEKHVYEAIMAETYLKGEAKGRADGIEQDVQQEREKNETENAARDKKIAEYLRSIGVSAEGVATALSIK